jgi:hypothetical protein
MDVQGGLLSCHARRAVEKQKSEGLVSPAVVAGMTVLCVRFRLVGGAVDAVDLPSCFRRGSGNPSQWLNGFSPRLDACVLVKHRTAPF